MINVIDSSVAVKWYAAETGSDRAVGLIGRPLVAPDLIRPEVANALWKKWRRGEIVHAQAIGALPHLSQALTLLPSEGFAEMALDLALSLGHPVYDCFFLAIAQTLDFPLITADKRFRERLRGTELEGRVVTLEDWTDE